MEPAIPSKTGGRPFGAGPSSNESINSSSPRKPDLPTYYEQKSGSSNNSIVSSNNQSNSKFPDDNNGTSTISENQSTTGTNSVHDSMLQRVVRLGKDSYTIKAYILCGNEHLFALECERPMSGYDGICPECYTEHVKLAKSRGFYASVNAIYTALEQQKLEKVRLQGRKTIDDLYKIKENLPPLYYPILGKYKGIEGDSNSCYMDATIFCMFAYNNVFDVLLHMDVKTEPLIKLQNLLGDNIVHVLRSNEGFVESDALFHLRAQLSEATGDPSFKEVKKEPSEFLRALEGLFHYAPFQTIPPDQPPKDDGSNVTTNIIWEMFDANPHNFLSTNIASIFRNSLSEIPAKLATIPPFLILVAPRHTRSQRSYRYIIPDRQIILDNNIVQLVCLKCKKTNHDPVTARDFYFCNKCYLQESSSLTTSTTDATVACYCPDCLSKLHKKPVEEIPDHDVKRIEMDKHKLNLFAVLCIETSHYVAFVKCQNRDQQQHEWVFFDSMSDRVYDEQNVPLVERVPDFDQWIEQAEKEKDFFFNQLDERRSQARPTSQVFSENAMRQLRLFRDGAFFFYENSNINYR